MLTASTHPSIKNSLDSGQVGSYLIEFLNLSCEVSLVSLNAYHVHGGGVFYSFTPMHVL